MASVSLAPLSPRSSTGFRLRHLSFRRLYRNYKLRHDKTTGRWIPDELVNLVFQYLDGATLAKCAMVCRQFRDLQEDADLWKNALEREKIELPNFHCTKPQPSTEDWRALKEEYKLQRLARTRLEKAQQAIRSRCMQHKVNQGLMLIKRTPGYVHPLKIVFVGDRQVGKTCLLITCAVGQFPGEYVPMIMDNYNAQNITDDRRFMIGYWDTASADDYDRLRPLAYPMTDVFIICFSLVSRTSLANAVKKWVPEVQQHCPEAVLLLVGTKMDLRTDPATMAQLAQEGETPITFHQGRDAALEIGARGYLECSAQRMEGTAEFMDTTIRTFVDDRLHTLKGRRRRRLRRKLRRILYFLKK